MASTVQTVFRIINFLIFIAILIGAYIIYNELQADKKVTMELNAMQKLYSSQKWQEFIDEHSKLLVKYPNIKEKYNNQLRIAWQNMAIKKYEEVIAMPLAQRASSSAEVIKFYNEASKYGPIDEDALLSYCDSLIESGDIAGAEKVIKEAESRTDVQAGKLSVYKITVERKKTGKGK